jgi:hypothetical protein
MAVLDFISRVHPASFVTRLPEQLKYTGWSKSLCAPDDLQYRMLQVMFKVSPASLQTFIDTPNCVLEDRVQYSTVHIPNVFCDGHPQIINCVGIVRIHWVFCVFYTVIIRCTETFGHPVPLSPILLTDAVCWISSLSVSSTPFALHCSLFSSHLTLFSLSFWRLL